MSQTQNNTYIIAGAIVFAGLLVALGIFFSSTDDTSQPAEDTNTPAAQEQPQEEVAAQLENITPVTEEDHVRGDTDAAVKIVEYSDFECPFCQRFHRTLNDVRENYADDELALVFRHFPIAQLHSKAPRVAKASECAAKLSSEDGAFWKFADSYFEKTPSNNRVNLEQVLPAINDELGVEQAAFAECLASDEFNDEIQADFTNANETGGKGTPWSIVIGPDGEKFPINGAQSQAAVESIIDSLL